MLLVLNAWSDCRIPRNFGQLHLRVEMLCRTRHNTIDTTEIQRDANKLRGILQFSPTKQQLLCFDLNLVIVYIKANATSVKLYFRLQEIK